MATTTNFGWETPDDTDLVKDGAAAIRTLGSAIDTSLVDLKGGTTGQLLTKATNADMDFSWASPSGIAASAFEAKGDILIGTGSGTYDNLALGTNNWVLTAASGETTGVKWAALPASGKILQVVGATTTTASSIASSSYTDSNISATITPTSTSSKILVIVTAYLQVKRDLSAVGYYINLVRGTSQLYEQQLEKNVGGAGSVSFRETFSQSYLDSPSTTSATTYKTQGRLTSTTNNAVLAFQFESNRSSITLLEIGA